MTKTERLIDGIASFVSRTRYDNLPDRVCAIAKIQIIDGVAVALAGSKAPGPRALQRHLRKFECRPVADVLGGRCGAVPPFAALANALSARTLEYDDVQVPNSSVYGVLMHPTAAILPAALAVGQVQKRSGRELLLSYVLGAEVACRVTDGVDPKDFLNGLSATARFGGLGATIAAAKLLGLGPTAIRTAILLWRVIGSAHDGTSGTMSRAPLREAYAAAAGVTAALLAADGMRAEPSLEKDSLGLSTIANDGVIRRLGNPFYVLKPGFTIRIYPSHPLCHSAQDLILAIVNLYGITPKQIKTIEVGITAPMSRLLLTTPPRGRDDARRSLPFAIALGVHGRTVQLRDFEKSPNDRPLQDTMRRVKCYVDRKLDALGHDRPPTTVRVVLHTGKVIQMKTDVAKGSPQKPLSQIELSHKFFQCALGVLHEQEAEQILNRLWQLEHVADVTILFNAGDLVDAPPSQRSGG